MPVNPDRPWTLASEDLAKMWINPEINWWFKIVTIWTEHKEITFITKKVEQTSMPIIDCLLCWALTLIIIAYNALAIDNKS